MKRIDGKVKDIVEVRPFVPLQDFSADPANTVSTYRFTDITSDLMSKWFQRLAMVAPERGMATALAGFRGVGKSHFVSVFGCLAGSPELGSSIDDPLVRSSTESFVRNQFTVASVRRGMGGTLLNELKDAISGRTGVRVSDLGEDADEILTEFVRNSPSTPVLLIDTVVGREDRVSRDDGTLLSHIAEVAKRLGIFVGIVLDDDISGADGANAAISGTFAIDFLDQEHLYKIVALHIFAKRKETADLLKSIYSNYRDLYPGFKWSEQRFVSLYPLHPAILEIAPMVRLYIQDFALLGFASEAGVKILGRPADSLIGVDEVFDAAENKLRHVAELKSLIDIFDLIDERVISKSPVGERLPAKLVLKGLLLFSLDGRGATASEISAAVMMQSSDDSAGIPKVENILAQFQEAVPEMLSQREVGEGVSKYLLGSQTSPEAIGEIEADAEDIPEAELWKILIRHTTERFSDAGLIVENGRITTHCIVEWEGSLRRGEIVWHSDLESRRSISRELFDWRIIVTSDGIQTDLSPLALELKWHPGKLTAEDKATLRRLHLLQTNEAARLELGDRLSTSLQALAITVGRIWGRVFMDEGRLEFGERDVTFGESPDSIHTLSQLFTILLGPVFKEEYPSHPRFDAVLDTRAASELISGFFSGKSIDSPNIQQMAESFAVPLDLAKRGEQGLVPLSWKELKEAAFSKEIDLLVESDDDTVGLDRVDKMLRARPYGLSREAIRSILAAYVSQGQIEFVTEGGNRIGSRSLDLHIIWDDIIGISKPAHLSYSTERLAEWAAELLGPEKAPSLSSVEDEKIIEEGLLDWLQAWRSEGIAQTFRELPDESVNVAIWQLSERVMSSFETIAKLIEEMPKTGSNVREVLIGIVESFSDSVDVFRTRIDERNAIKRFLDGFREREASLKLLSVLEPVDNDQFELLRSSLIEGVALADPLDSDQQVVLAAKAREFASLHRDRRVEIQNKGETVGTVREVVEEIMSSREWQEFDVISRLRWFSPINERRIRRILHKIRWSERSVKPLNASESNDMYADLLHETQPVDLVMLREEIYQSIADGRTEFRKNVALDLSSDEDSHASMVDEAWSKFDPEMLRRLQDPFDDFSLFHDVPTSVLNAVKSTSDLYGAEMIAEDGENVRFEVRHADSSDVPIAEVAEVSQ